MDPMVMAQDGSRMGYHQHKYAGLLMVHACGSWEPPETASATTNVLPWTWLQNSSRERPERSKTTNALPVTSSYNSVLSIVLITRVLAHLALQIHNLQDTRHDYGN
jgi:hypothetical protein